MNKAILLAAGEGLRLRPLTRVLPKCLVPVNGQPLLGRWLGQLAAAGVSEVKVNTGYLPELVEAYLAGGRWDCKVGVVREPVLRGTGGTLGDLTGFWRDEGTLLIHADNLSDIDLARFVHFHRQGASSCLLTLATFETTVPAECGIVVSDARGVVREFHEKVPQPPGNCASAAIFALNPALAGVLPPSPDAALDFSRDVVPGLLGRMRAWHHAGFHRDIGSGERYLTAQWQFPGAVAQPDRAWSALLDADRGALRAELVDALHELAGEAGYATRVLGHSDAVRASAGRGERDLTIVKRVHGGYSAEAMYRELGARSVVVDVEDGGNKFVR